MRYIDPEPENKIQPAHERARYNRFTTSFESTRFAELITEKNRFDPRFPYDNLAIPLRDIVRYWWNHAIDKNMMLENIFEDLYDHFKDRLIPEQPKREELNLDDVMEDVLEGVG